MNKKNNHKSFGSEKWLWVAIYNARSIPIVDLRGSRKPKDKLREDEKKQ